ncbi:MAG: FAD-dependent oxidoreductase [Chloroflexi bacterium]|nr:FAD-dependent oxidoreductase [Chloroflexota bacterium]
MSVYAVIGSGAAGLAAANAIRARDPAGQILILSDDPHGHYSRPGLAYVLSGELPEKQVAQFPRKVFLKQKLQFVESAVQAVYPAEHALRLHNDRALRYDRLLIATGAAAALPDTPGIQLEGVVKLDSMADCQHILRLARRARRAVVVGGGITAIELVEGLAARGVEVHYFLRGERYWSAVLDEVESRIVEARLVHDGVKIHYHTNLVEVQGHKGRVNAVQADENGRPVTLPCQVLAVAIGIQPRMELAVQAGLATQRGIIVDDHLRTSAPDVFAAGDVAQVFDAQSGQYLLDSLWTPAIQQGRAAGANMAGGDVIYEKKFPFNVTRLAGLVTTVIGRVGKGEAAGGRPKGDADVAGIMRGDSEEWRLAPEAVVAQTYSGDNRLRLYLKDNVMVGAVVMGDQALSRPIQVFIQQQVDLGQLRERLLAENADVVKLLGDFWEGYRVKHAAKIP